MTVEEIKEIINCAGFKELACDSCPSRQNCKGAEILNSVITPILN